MKTLVFGASLNPSRYSNLAVKLLRTHKHEVIAVGKTPGNIGSVSVIQEIPEGEHFDTITLYMNPDHQKLYYQKIIGTKPRRIIFNPGAENEELKRLAEKSGIKTEEACTLVMLNTGQY